MGLVDDLALRLRRLAHGLAEVVPLPRVAIQLLRRDFVRQRDQFRLLGIPHDAWPRVGNRTLRTLRGVGAIVGLGLVESPHVSFGVPG